MPQRTVTLKPGHRPNRPVRGDTVQHGGVPLATHAGIQATENYIRRQCPVESLEHGRKLRSAAPAADNQSRPRRVRCKIGADLANLDQRPNPREGIMWICGSEITFLLFV